MISASPSQIISVSPNITRKQQQQAMVYESLFAPSLFTKFPAFLRSESIKISGNILKSVTTIPST